MQRPDELWSCNVSGKNFEYIRAEFKRSDRFGRGENTGHARNAVPCAKAENAFVKVRRNNILGSGENGNARRFAVKHCACADNDVAVQGIFVRHMLNEPVCFRHGKGQLDCRNAALNARFGNAFGLGFVLCSDNGNKTAAFNS